ncbi:integrase [Synechococcus sp. PROS-9-1]|nr:integrase [Synechococcus sp. PROS-9-1]
MLVLPRSTLYYRPTPVRESTLQIMARIDSLYLEDPYSGSRRMVDYLARDGIPISRDRVRNLMRCMGLRAIYRKPRTTVPGDPLERFPCLVDLKQTTRVDQFWATAITYIPLQKGFLYVVAVVICSPGTCSAGSSRTALTRSSASMPWRWRWRQAASQRSSTPTRAASSPLLSLWPGCRPRRSRSAGQAESAATTTSRWRGCGARSNTRRCIYMPTAMAGRLKSA